MQESVANKFEKAKALGKRKPTGMPVKPPRVQTPGMTDASRRIGKMACVKAAAQQFSTSISDEVRTRDVISDTLKAAKAYWAWCKEAD